MTTILFIWYIITHIQAAPACSLWVGHVPTSVDFAAACRGYDLADLRLSVRTLDGETVCEDLPGSDLYLVDIHCRMEDPHLDNHILILSIPAHDELTCSVTVTHTGAPTQEEIVRQCGTLAWSQLQSGTATIQLTRSQTVEPPTPKCAAPDLRVGLDLYEQAPSAESLRTYTLYTWLAGRLIWYGITRPQCPNGYSGIDPLTMAATPCGMAYSKQAVIDWQNRWDAQIYAAAVAYSVPARMLKRMMGLESQFWPLYVGKAGETSVMQITENGADVLLRYDPTLDTGYAGRSEKANFWRRLYLRNSFDCHLCGLKRAVEHTADMIPMFARLLAAYRCRAVSINPTLGGVPAWQQAAIDYNGSEDYRTLLETPQ